MQAFVEIIRCSPPEAGQIRRSRNPMKKGTLKKKLMFFVRPFTYFV
jgi:hypothetical protein